MKRVYNFGAGPAMLPTEVMEKAQAEFLNYMDMGAGVIEISHRSKEFDAIINPPQGSILAIGGISRVMTEMEDGSGEFRSKLSVAMSCDHRAIDGAAGAKFMATLKSMIEDPELFF